MNTKSGWVALGAVISTAIVAVLYALLEMHWVVPVVVASAGLVGYIVAAIAASPTSHTTTGGELMRGFLVGLNAASNAVLITWIFDGVFGLVPALIIGLVLGTLNWFLVFGPISRNGFFQGIAGYLNWLLPMSWPVVALGFGLTVFSYLLHAITIGKVGFLKVQKMRFDGKTGTVFIKGGLVSNLNYAKTAFNMGNFSFVFYTSSAWHIEHEAGHTLNLAAFGSLFHFIGAVDENVIQRGHRAFAERIAESNDSGSGIINIPMWS